MSDEKQIVERENTHDAKFSYKTFDSISAGLYWRSLVDMEDQGITKGMVLLIKSIRYFEGEIHTIILRAHPLNIDKSFKVKLSDKSWTYKQITEHKFLLKEFVKLFEFEPDSEKIRESEVAAIQKEMDKLNLELMEAQKNPDILNKFVETKLIESVDGDDQQSKELVSPSQIPNTISKAISIKPTTQIVDGYIKQAEKHTLIAEIKSNWMTSKTNEIAKTISKLTPFYEERAAAAIALADETIRSVKKIKRGIESLYLFTGKEVDVLTICKGKSADSNIPLSLCARKLFVDEELSVFLDVDEWFDFTDMDKFYDALKKYPALVDQIFPTQRCMLVMATNEKSIDYGNQLENMRNNKWNKEVFLMVRDGENIHLVDSPVESHLGANNLFPTQAQSDKIFKGIDGSDITIEDVTFTDAIEEHELFELHYKRWLILAAGLDEREKLFGEFYPGNAGLDFITLDFQDKYLNFIQDEHALLHDHMDVESWIEEKNKYTRPGSRVFLSLRNSITKESAPGAYTTRQIDYEYQKRVLIPWGEYDTFITTKKGKALNVSTQLEGCISDKLFTINIDLNKVDNSQYRSGDLPFLCIDRVKESELLFYIKSREARKGHLSYIRIFKKVREQLNKEMKAQKELRVLLKNAILTLRDDLSDKDITDLMDESISTWRAYNRGKEVSDLRPSDKKNWSILLDHVYYALNSSKYVDEIENMVKELGYKPLRVALAGNATMKVYYEPHDAEMDNRLQDHPWVHCSVVRLGKRKISVMDPRWVNLLRKDASVAILKDYDDSENWYDKDDAFGSYKKKQTAFEKIENWNQNFKEISSTDPDVFERNVRNSINKYNNHQSLPGEFVKYFYYRIPVGYELRGDTINTISLVIHDALIFLASISNDLILYTKIMRTFVNSYANKNYANEAFEQHIKDNNFWRLEKTEGVDRGNDQFFSCAKGPKYYKFLRVDKLSSHTPLLSEQIKNYTSQELVDNKTRYFGRKDFHGCLFAQDIENSAFKIFDKRLGIELPENYEPFAVSYVRLRYDNEKEWFKFYDVYPWKMKWNPLSQDNDQSGFDNNKRRDFFADSSQKVYYTKALALESINLQSKNNIVPSKDLQGQPQPKNKHVTRFYLIPEDE